LAYTDDVAITTAPWKVHRPRAAAVRETAAAVPERQIAREPRTRRYRGSAAATTDVFIDVVVILSALLFIALVAGIGILALQQSVLNWPN
jgi:hypothetical protein